MRILRKSAKQGSRLAREEAGEEWPHLRARRSWMNDRPPSAPQERSEGGDCDCHICKWPLGSHASTL